MVEPESGFDIVIDQIKLSHRPNDIALLYDADTIDRPARVTLDNVNGKTLAPQCNRRCKASDAAPDD